MIRLCNFTDKKQPANGFNHLERTLAGESERIRTGSLVMTFLISVSYQSFQSHPTLQRPYPELSRLGLFDIWQLNERKNPQLYTRKWITKAGHVGVRIC